MKMEDYIYKSLGYNIHDFDYYDNSKIKSYIQKSEITLGDVKNFIRKNDKASDLIEILNNVDEDFIQNYLREKKIKKLKDIIKK